MSWWRRRPKPEATTEEMMAYIEACARAKPGTAVMAPPNATKSQLRIAQYYIHDMHRAIEWERYQRMADGIYLTSS